MNEDADATFTGGRNIAMNVPPHLWEATVQFYRGVVRRDEIEPLPEGLEGFWISSPASIVHLVAGPDQV
ncbi:MAG: hypothetical protein ACRDJC_22130 [Thermomicrobiales bacterium]